MIPQKITKNKSLLQKGQLLAAGLAQIADAQAQQSQWARDEFFAPEEKTGEAINISGFCNGFLDGNLARERGEITVAEFHLHSVGAEAAAFHARRNIGGLFAQAMTEDFSIVGVVQEGFFVADAFYFVAQFQRAIVFAESKTFQDGTEGTDERAEIARVILHRADGVDAGFVQNFLSFFADAVEGAHGERAKELDFFAVGNQCEAVGLFVVARDFCEKFVRGDADGGGQLSRRTDAVFELSRERKRLLQGAIEVVRLAE